MTPFGGAAAPAAGYVAPPRFLSRRTAVIFTAVAAILAAAVVAAVIVSRSYGPLEPAASFGPRPVGEIEYRVVHSLEPDGRTVRFRWSDHCARGEAGVGGPPARACATAPIAPSAASRRSSYPPGS